MTCSRLSTLSLVVGITLACLAQSALAGFRLEYHKHISSPPLDGALPWRWGGPVCERRLDRCPGQRRNVLTAHHGSLAPAGRRARDHSLRAEFRVTTAQERVALMHNTTTDLSPKETNMTDKATQLAQAAADGLSRRSFLGRLSQIAGGAAGGFAALLVTNSAGAGSREKKVCQYICLPHLTSIYKEIPADKSCPDHWRGCVLFW